MAGWKASVGAALPDDEEPPGGSILIEKFGMTRVLTHEGRLEWAKMFFKKMKRSSLVILAFSSTVMRSSCKKGQTDKSSGSSGSRVSVSVSVSMSRTKSIGFEELKLASVLIMK